MFVILILTIMIIFLMKIQSVVTWGAWDCAAFRLTQFDLKQQVLVPEYKEMTDLGEVLASLLR